MKEGSQRAQYFLKMEGRVISRYPREMRVDYWIDPALQAHTIFQVLLWTRVYCYAELGPSGYLYIY
jgi:hypothetical protein